jgi:hypothetical protein
VRTLVAVTIVTLALPHLASGSVQIGSDAVQASLRVGADGTAEARWRTPSGERRVAVVTPGGNVRWGRRLGRRDVSTPATGARIPLAVTIRRTPDGNLWALQAWRRLRTGPVELRFSRWRGDATLLSLEAVCCRWRSERIQGRALFHGRPVYGFGSTPKGVPLDDLGRNVYLDTFRDGGWRRMMGILTHRPTGFYRIWIRPHWRGTRYRGTIIGPNRGWTLAPDARASTASALR